MAVKQKTLKSAIHCTGVGVHSNHKVRVKLCPAPPDHGIRFRRVDPQAESSGIVKALYGNVVDTTLNTTIGNGEVAIRTVEHLMAAFAGCEIDNVLVELHGDEVPAMDGSAAPFVFLVDCAGIVEQEMPRRAIEVLKPVEVVDGERRIRVTPAPRFSLLCEIEFDHPAVGRQSLHFRSPLRRTRGPLARFEPCLHPLLRLLELHRRMLLRRLQALCVGRCCSLLSLLSLG